MLLPKTTQELKNMLPKINIHLLLIAIIVISIPVTVLISRQKESVNRNVLATQEESIADLTNAVISSGTGISKQTSATDSLVISKAQKRKDMMLKLANDDSAKFLLYALPPSITDNLNPLVKEYIEKEAEVSGEIKIIHSDDFKNEKSEEEYLLYVNENGINRIYTLNGSQVGTNIKTGTQVKVKGYKLDDRLVLNGSADALQVTRNSPSSTKGVQRTLVIMVTFNDYAVEDVPVKTVKEQFFTNPASLASYYEEASYGQTHFTGDVVGYYPLPMSNQGCDTHQIAQKATAAAIAHGVDPLAYTRLVYIGRFAGCTRFAGRSTLGGNPSESWINTLYIVNAQGNPIYFRYVIEHEVGHQLGLLHADFWDCIDKVMGDQNKCKHHSFADLSDIMGNARDKHINGPHKQDLVWLSPSQTLDVNSSGNFSISRLEDNSPGLKVIRVPMPTSDLYYYLSYRQPIGLDSNFAPEYIRGASVHAKHDIFSTSVPIPNESLLLDSTPDNLDYGQFPFQNAALGDNEIINDPTNGITIKQLSHDIAKVNLQITLDKSTCRRGVPQASLTPISQGAPAGQTLQYQVQITNTDMSVCGSTDFSVLAGQTDSSPSPYGWSFRTNPISIVILPGQTKNITVNITSPASAVEWLYGLHSIVSSIQPRHTVELSHSYIVTGPPITPTKTPTPTPTKVPTPTPVIDVSTPSPSADSYVSSAAPDLNFGGSTQILVGNSPKTIGYMTFDLRSIKGKKITGAELLLKVPLAAGGDSPGNFKIKLTDSNWGEKTITYNNKPTLGAMVGTFSAPTRGEQITIDLDTLLKGTLVPDKISFGIESGTSNPVILKAREAAGGSPNLLLNYER